MNCRVVLRELKILKKLEYENVVKLIKVVDMEGLLIKESLVENIRGVSELFFVEELFDFDLY